MRQKRIKLGKWLIYYSDRYCKTINLLLFSVWWSRSMIHIGILCYGSWDGRITALDIRYYKRWKKRQDVYTPIEFHLAIIPWLIFLGYDCKKHKNRWYFCGSSWEDRSWFARKIITPLQYWLQRRSWNKLIKDEAYVACDYLGIIDTLGHKHYRYRFTEYYYDELKSESAVWIGKFKLFSTYGVN